MGYHDAVFTDGPAVSFRHEQSEEAVAGAAFLFDPGLAAVTGAKNGSAVADYPAVLIIGKIDAHECCRKVCRHQVPSAAAVLGS